MLGAERHVGEDDGHRVRVVARVEAPSERSPRRLAQHRGRRAAEDARRVGGRSRHRPTASRGPVPYRNRRATAPVPRAPRAPPEQGPRRWSPAEPAIRWPRDRRGTAPGRRRRCLGAADRGERRPGHPRGVRSRGSGCTAPFGSGQLGEISNGPCQHKVAVQPGYQPDRPEAARAAAAAGRSRRGSAVAPPRRRTAPRASQPPAARPPSMWSVSPVTNGARSR